jgi:hypothetical protein
VSGSAHSKLVTPRAKVVSCQGSPPNGLMSQSCGLAGSPGLALGAGRAETKAMSCPPGDHFGLELLSVPRVSSTSRFSVRLDRTRFETRSFFSLSATLLTQTTWRLSGEICAPPADSAMTRSSTVHLPGDEAGACGACARAQGVKKTPDRASIMKPAKSDLRMR